mgnify:CR=1 FL=1
MKKMFFSLLCCWLAIGFANSQPFPYQNAALTAQQRADDLIARLTLEEKVSLMMDSSPAIERLGIPQFQWWNEALHGIGRNGYATVFPITMAMAPAAWAEVRPNIIFPATQGMRNTRQEA